MSAHLESLRHRRGSHRLSVTILATGVAGVATLLMATGPAIAAGTGGAPQVNNRETVKIDADPAGIIKGDPLLFSQLLITGNGHIVVADPTSTKNLRNLNGFAAPTVRDGQAIWTINVDGKQEERTVSVFDKSKLPVTISASYTLDGKPIAGKDLVHKSGRLQATFHVRNISATPTPISYQDANGNTITKTVDIVMPLVGQLSTTLPGSFKNVSTPRADIAGDGHGANLLTWTMVLFSPIGETDQTFGYTADLADASLPEVQVQIVPVSPQRHPELKFGEDGMQSGALTSQQIAFAGSALNENLTKLADGTGTLLDGLQQLYAGAAQLHDGLAGDASSGAHQLADGLAQARAGVTNPNCDTNNPNDLANPCGLKEGAALIADGSQQAAAGGDELSGGLVKLSAGATKVSNGLGDAKAGSSQLSAGLLKLSRGMVDLDHGFYSPTGGSDLVTGSQDLASGIGLIIDGVTRLPTDIQNDPGFKALKKGITDMQDAIGALTDVFPAQQTLEGGLNATKLGLSNPACNPADPTNPANPCGFKEIFGLLQASLDHVPDAGNPVPGAKQALLSVIAGLDNASATSPGVLQAVESMQAAPSPTNPLGFSCPDNTLGLDATGQPDATYLTAHPHDLCAVLSPAGFPDPSFVQALYMKVALAKIKAGIGSAAATNTMLYGLNAVVAGIGDASTPGQTAMYTLQSLRDAIDTKLLPGLATLKAGLSNPGCNLADPTNPANPCGLKQAMGLVSTGIDQLVAGIATQIASTLGGAEQGAGDLADGIATAADGVTQLDAGAADAASGASQLNSGLGQLNSGGKQLAAGAADASSGAKQLDAGLHELSAGTSNPSCDINNPHDATNPCGIKEGAASLADGLVQLDAGGHKLAAGIDDAASGAGQIHDGLGQAIPGAKQIKSGQQQLNAQAAKPLLQSASASAIDYGRNYAILKAMDTKAQDGGLPYGAPQGASGTAAYMFTLAGASTQGSDNLRNGVGAVALLGVSSLGGALLRRRFAA